MTDSIRESILAHAVSILGATSGVSGRVYRSRPEALSKAESPALLVEPLLDSATYTNMDKIEWSLQFRVTVVTRGLAPDNLADPVITSLYSILMADRTLGGLCFDILPQEIAFRVLDGDNPIGIADCTFTVRYRTSAQALTS